MKLILSLVVLMFVFSTNIRAQTDKSIGFDIAGVGGVGSINYSSPLKQADNSTLLIRAGFSIAPVDRNNGTALVFPVLVHYNLGANKHKLDLGIGQAISITTRGSFFFRTPLNIGYLYEPSDKRFYFRAGYTPLISYLFDFQFEHWGGISFGLKLK